SGGTTRRTRTGATTRTGSRCASSAAGAAVTLPTRRPGRTCLSMARTRQKAKQRKAKRRAQEERTVQGTTGQKPPSNPAEQAVVEQAEAYEVADAIEESGGDVEAAQERIDEEESDEAIKPVRESQRTEARTKTPERPAKRSTATRAERRDGRARQPRP